MQITAELHSNEKILIRNGVEADIPAVFGLVAVLAEFEKAGHEVITNPDIYNSDFKNGWFEFLVAESELEGVIGIALYYQSYSTWKGKMIYLDDLVVNPSYRSQGVGTLLLDALIQESRDRNASLLKWQVLDWNKDAIRFYKRRNVIIEDEWLNCKLSLLP